MARQRRLDGMVGELADGMRLRAKSLIISVYGDAIVAHGGTIWLGSLIRLLEPLGLSERMVRTAVFRLSRDGWMTSFQVGRRSYYSLSEHGRRQFEGVYRRIYDMPRDPWDGRWLLLFVNCERVEPRTRDALRTQLGWQGFGAVSSNVLAHPAGDMDAVRPVLADLGVDETVVPMRGRAEDMEGLAPQREMVRCCWDLDRIAETYNEFLDRFRPVLQVLQAEPESVSGETCFHLRMLLMHDWRRKLLRDPLLPEELLPADWPGTASRVLVRNLYRLLRGPSEQFLMDTGETADGPLPEAAPFFYARFGGLSNGDGQA